MNSLKKYRPEYIPLLVLGMIFLQNLREEGKVTLRHEGAHCRSAESIRTACESYFRRQFWSRVFDWLGWIAPGVLALIVIWVPLNFWYFLLPVSTTIVCVFLHRWFDPEKFVRANPQMNEFIKIHHLWESQRELYIKSGFVGHLIPSFYRLSEHESTLLGFECIGLVINGATRKLCNSLKEIMIKAMLKVAREYHIVEHTGDAERISKARKQLELLLGQLNEGSCTFISKWTVGKALQFAVMTQRNARLCSPPANNPAEAPIEC